MEKKQIVAKAKIQEGLHAKMQSAKSVIFVDFRGVSVADDTRLRRAMRESGVYYAVVKNTLAQRAVTQLGWQGLEGMFHGPTAMAVSETDPVSAAKVLATLAREIPALKAKGGVLEGGEVLDAEAVAYLGTLPSKEELIARVCGTLNSPITSLVTVLNATLTGFARAVDALREKKEQAAD
jgi:large subunit ribosomal protein L10